MLLRGGTDMASKSANVMVRVEPEIKVQAESGVGINWVCRYLWLLTLCIGKSSCNMGFHLR